MKFECDIDLAVRSKMGPKSRRPTLMKIIHSVIMGYCDRPTGWGGKGLQWCVRCDKILWGGYTRIFTSPSESSTLLWGGEKERMRTECGAIAWAYLN